MFKISKQVSRLIEYEKFKTIPDEPLVEVDALSTSCMLLNRDCIVQIYDRFGGKPYEDRIEWYTEAWEIVDVDVDSADEEKTLICNHISEDMLFCKRAKAIWFKIFVDTTINAEHLVEDNSVRSQDFKNPLTL